MSNGIPIPEQFADSLPTPGEPITLRAAWAWGSDEKDMEAASNRAASGPLSPAPDPEESQEGGFGRARGDVV